jgi:glycosyltransferase involved in cell wall biosynthesis
VGHLGEEIHNMREGILVPPKDVKALAEAMIRLANDKGLRDTFSENLRRKMKGMLWRDVATKTFQFYRELLETA